MVRVSQPGLRPHRTTHETGGSDQLTDLTLSKLKMTGDIDLGANSIRTTGVIIRETPGGYIEFRSLDFTAYRNIEVDSVYLHSLLRMVGWAKIRQARESATDCYRLQSNNGSSFIDNLKFMGGFVKAYNLISMGGFGKYQWDGDDIIFSPKVKLDDPDCNLALNGSASDFGAGLNPENAIDADPTTYAGEYSNGEPSEINILQVDLGAILDFHLAIKMGLHSSYGGIKAIVNIYVSDDGSSWTNIRTEEESSSVEQIHRRTIENLSGRYIKLTLKVDNDAYVAYAKIYEIVCIPS